jgi:hypothetical protein
MSFAARLLNVFATPGEVFEDVKAAPPSVANWLVPAVLLGIVSVFFAVIIFSQPVIKQQLREQWGKVFETQVSAGHLTREKAEQNLDDLEKLILPIGIFSGVISSPIRLAWWALVLWLLGRWFLKVRFSFVKALEVAGLAAMIVVLGVVVTLLLTVNLANFFATPSLALLVKDFDTARKGHLLLGAANVFSIWLVGVMSVGLARLAGVPFLRAAWVVFGFWVVQQLFFIYAGFGDFAIH